MDGYDTAGIRDTQGKKMIPDDAVAYKRHNQGAKTSEIPI